MNYMLMQMVKGKTAMISREVGEGVPYVQARAIGIDGNVNVKSTVAKKDGTGTKL
jgi:hypothetical protein